VRLLSGGVVVDSRGLAPGAVRLHLAEGVPLLRDLKRTTIRSYSEAVRAFCHFATDPLYGWAETCEKRFGTHPVQVVHEWNTVVHVQDTESDAGKRAFTLRRHLDATVAAALQAQAGRQA
jgi:hypothetical protein